MIYSAKLPDRGLGFSVVKIDNVNTYSILFTLNLDAALKDLNSKNLFTGENEYFTKSPIYFTSNITVNGTQVASCTNIKITDSLTSYNFGGEKNVYEQLNANKITQEIRCNLTLTHPKFILKYESEPITFLATKSIQKTSLIDKNNRTVATILETPFNETQIEEAKRNGIVVFNTDPQFLIIGDYQPKDVVVENPKFIAPDGTQLRVRYKNYATNGTAASAVLDAEALRNSRYTAGFRYLYNSRTGTQSWSEDITSANVRTSYRTASRYLTDNVRKGVSYYTASNNTVDNGQIATTYEYRYTFTRDKLRWYKVTPGADELGYNYLILTTGDAGGDNVYVTFGGTSYRCPINSGSTRVQIPLCYYRRVTTSTIENEDENYADNNKVVISRLFSLDARDRRVNYRYDGTDYIYSTWTIKLTCSGNAGERLAYVNGTVVDVRTTWKGGDTEYYTVDKRYDEEWTKQVVNKVYVVQHNDLRFSYTYETIYYRDGASFSLMDDNWKWGEIVSHRDYKVDRYTYDSYYAGSIDTSRFNEVTFTPELVRDYTPRVTLREDSKYTYTYYADYTGWDIDSNGTLKYRTKNARAVEYTERYS